METVKVKLCENRHNPEKDWDEPGETIEEADAFLINGGFELLPGNFLHAPAGKKVWFVFPSEEGDTLMASSIPESTKETPIVGAKREIIEPSLRKLGSV